jgi:hypothetical protein
MSEIAKNLIMRLRHLPFEKQDNLFLDAADYIETTMWKVKMMRNDLKEAEYLLLRSNPKCKYLHHSIKDLHPKDEPCPLEQRIRDWLT